jgi:hypothetical protein
METKENVMFEEAEVGEIASYSSLTDSTFDEDADSIAGLASFLSRPVLIQEVNWTEGASDAQFPTYDIHPWHAYFADSKIANKVKNFGRIHCKLHLKFMFNSSPFYYGALRATYEPLRDMLQEYSNAKNLIPASQMPGVYIMPQGETVTEMELPFLCPTNWLNPMSVSDLQGMGTLRWWGYVPLHNVNNEATTSINVSVYAWAEDVTVSGLTSLETLQSEAQPEKGKVSGLMSKAGQLAGSLSSLPVIGQYASLASAGAKVAGSVAAAFGLCNEPVTSDVNPMAPKAFHAFANVETSMPIDKLCIDPNNVVTTDLSVAGTEGEDPLAMSELLRESLLVSQQIGSSATAGYNVLSIRVNPGAVLSENLHGTSSVGWYHTPLAYYGRFFELWRGSLIYRFKFVKTKFHQGRVRVSWDPAKDISTEPDSETVTLSKIFDLSVGDEFEFEVPYKSKRMWNRVAAVTPYQISDGAFSFVETQTNGILSLKVHNKLTSPVTPCNITVSIYVRPGADFQFAQPKELPSMSLWDVQSEAVPDGTRNKTGEHIAQITVGENIRSIRPFLHRTSLSHVQPVGNPHPTGTTDALGAGIVASLNLLPRLPLWFGYNSDYGFNWAYKMLDSLPHKSTKFNASVTHPICWVLNCFAGNRGSVNIQVNILGGSENTGTRIESASLERTTQSCILHADNQDVNRASHVLEYGGSSLANLAAANVPVFGATVFPAGQRGITVTKEITQSALAANIPQYTPYRLNITRPDYPWGMFSLSGDSWASTIRLDTIFSRNSSTSTITGWPIAEVYYSAGSDFQPVFFTCVPPMFSYSATMNNAVVPEQTPA